MISPNQAVMLPNVAEAHPLSGFSGADVFRVTLDGRNWFVRKAAAERATSARLRIQAAKQRAFGCEAGGFLRTPRILGEGEIDGRYYFDMEYVRGPDAVKYLRQTPYKDVATFANRLCNYLTTASGKAPLTTSATPSFFDSMYGKLCEVQRGTQRIQPDHLSRLFLALNKVRNLPQLAPSLCHGDLTLQNMVIDEEGGIWVLDLLDAPFEHYWQDVAKLHQDLSGGWYLLEQKPIAQCVLDYLRERLLAVAVKLQPLYAEVHPLLMACTFVRILPYARTAEQIQFVTERIDFFAGQTKI